MIQRHSIAISALGLTTVALLAIAGPSCSSKSNPAASPTGRPVPSGPFLSTSVPGLQLWLKADSITGISDGGTVSSWTDSSANANSAVQPTTALQPTYKASVVNNLPVVRFGGTQYLSSPAIPASGAAGRTVVAVVANVTQTGTGYNHVIHWGTIPIAGTSYPDQSYGLVVRCNPTETGNDGTNMGNHYWTDGFSSSFAPTANAMLLETSYNGSIDTFFLNGFSGGTKAIALNTGGTSTMIGTRADATVEFLTGDIAELLVFSPNLSAADQNTVEIYLNYKYAIY